MKKIILLFIPLIFFTSCEENIDDGPYNLCYEITINSEVPGYYHAGGYESLVDYETIYLTGDVTSGSATYCNTILSNEIIDNCFSEYFSVGFYAEDNGCSSISVDVFLEEEFKHSEQFQLGCVNGIYDGGHSGGIPHCNTYCNITGNSYDISLNICL